LPAFPDVRHLIGRAQIFGVLSFGQNQGGGGGARGETTMYQWARAFGDARWSGALAAFFDTKRKVLVSSVLGVPTPVGGEGACSRT